MNRDEFPVRLQEGESTRVDKFVASLGMFTRSQISQRSVRVLDAQGRILKLSRKISDGDTVVVEWDDPPSSNILPEPMDLDVLYDDDDCIVLNKAQGVVVHPAYGNLHGTLVQGLLHRFENLDKSFNGDRVRPGVVHRLDKDTSGLIIAAKNPDALEALAGQFRSRSVKKTYLAVLRGIPSAPEGRIEDSIGRDPRNRKKFTVGVRNAKDAQTLYKVLESTDGYALVQLRILTGRTHQIRVHMKSLGCPVLGDDVYGRRDPDFPETTLMLHSWKLKIRLPNGENKRFTAPIPLRFYEVLDRLGFSTEKIDRE
ncbi:MAG: RluA family pseudouridine synthase [Spirochaetaceae bacterium]|nr:RluA family pseudouridine synthase [Spirochaetaceae bacterium]MDT8297347.1 RluA family pseudouridine synthase [Spirochaetaceae bacterium]